MKLMALAATLALLVFGVSPAFAGTVCGDQDGDGVDDCEDNCSDKVNAAQDDTDGDGCGNVCDADYGQTGSVDFADFTAFAAAFNTVAPNIKVTQPNGNPVDFADFTYFANNFGSVPAGKSGTTSGTTACP